MDDLEKSQTVQASVKPLEVESFLRGIRRLSGTEIMHRLMQVDDPREMIRCISAEDFYWMIKKVGEQEVLFLLELASEEQWQYVLDLETWSYDRLDLENSVTWLDLLAQADPLRLVRWLFSGEESLVTYLSFRSLDVIVVEDEEEAWDIPDGFFSLDGVHYIRARNSEDRPLIEQLLRIMADEDYDRYHSLLVNLDGVLPAELEEEMYRLRNVRMAEHGFLPREEALEIYAPLDPGNLKPAEAKILPRWFEKTDEGGLVPIAPLEHAESGNLLTEIVATRLDPGLRDRIRLEFAGLCNQILSADGGFSPEFETLVRVCQKAVSYVNLGLEGLCGKDYDTIEKMLKDQRLVSMFRVGYSLALKVKWEAERWVARGWFAGKGLKPGFWGEYWGGILSGILRPRPVLYVGAQRPDEFRDFEWLSDLAECLKVIRRLMVLDGLLEKLAGVYRLDPELLEGRELTFRPLFFNLWCRRLLKAEPSFDPITLAQAKSFLNKLRSGKRERGAPYPMTGYDERFVKDFMAFAADSNPEAALILEETLLLVWQEFQDEVEWVSLEDLDSRYSKFLLIKN